MTIINKVAGQLAHITTYDPLTGEVTGFTPVGNIELGPVSNISITGGTAGQALVTDGAGNLTFATIGGSGSYGDSNVSAYLAGNITTDVIPATPTQSLGSLTNPWNELYVTGNTIYVEGIPLALGANDTLEFNNVPLLQATGNTNISTTGNIQAAEITAAGNIIANTGYFFIGDGGLLSNVSGTGSYSNANVENYLPTYTGNLSGGNITVTGTATAANYAGDGGLLSNIAAANITGTVASATVAASANTVAGANVTGIVANATFATTAAQATSAITATVATTAHNVAGANVTGAVAFATTANSVAGANVTGEVALANYAAYAGNVTIAAQPNITSIGTLTSLAVAGNLSAGNTSAGNLLTANFITGTLTTAAQPNITSVGTLLDLTVQGNAQVDGNVITDDIISRTGDITISASGTDQNVTLVPSGTGYVDVSAALIKNLQDPVDVQDAATKGYVDSVAEGLSVQDPCTAATDADLATITGGSVTYNNGTAGVGATLTLSIALTVLDGITLNNGDRVLIKNETNTAENGIYTWATGGTVLTRATDFNDTTDIIPGDFVFVSSGTQYASTGWVQTATITTVGTDPILFTQFSGAGAYTAGTGLTLTGTQFSLTNTSVTAGTYGNATHVVTQTVNAQGQITSITQQEVIANAETLNGTTLKNTVLSSNLTSVGTLVGLSVNGDALVTGNLQVDTNIGATGNVVAGNLTTTGLLTSGNAVLGNTATANFFAGDGGQLSNIAAANIVDAYGNANVSVYLASGTDTAGYVTTGNVEAGFLIGDGAEISNIAGANVSGEVAFAAVANSVAGANVSGQVASAASADLATFATTANAVAGANVSGEVAFAAVANSVAGANVSGEVSFAQVANSVSGANVSGTVASATVAASANSVAGANVSGEVAFASTANSVAGANVSGQVASAAVADLATFATTANSVAGANVSGEVAFAAVANSVAGANVSGEVAFAATANAVSGSNVSGQVASAASADLATFATTANSVAGANVSGQVASASVADLATFATTANAVAGANVTGQVASAAVADLATFATTANAVAGANVSGEVTFAATANAVAGANVSGEVTFAATANSVAGANVTGEVANAAFATTAGSADSVDGANISGVVANANYAAFSGQVVDSAQANITSVGTLTELAVTGTTDLGNLNASGQVVLNGVTITESQLTTTGAGFEILGTDQGVQIQSLDTANSTFALVFADNTGAGLVTDAGEIIVGIDGNVTVTDSMSIGGDLSTVGVVNVGNGTIQFPTGGFFNISPNATSNLAGIDFTDDSGTILLYSNVQIGLTTDSGGTAYTWNFNQDGTMYAPGNLDVFGIIGATLFAGDGGNLFNINASNVVGNLDNVSSVGNATTVLFGDGANITGLPAGYSNADVSTYLASGTDTAGYVTTGNVDAAFFNGDGVGISNIAGANITGQVSNALIAGTVYEAAQPNITSVGTLTTLEVSGNVLLGNANIGNLIVTGTTTTANVTDLDVANATIVISSGANALVSNGAGLFIGSESPTVGSLTYLNASNSWNSSLLFQAPNFTTPGNVTGSSIIGEGGNLSNITAANITGTVASATVAASANAVAGANVSGEVSFAATANSVSGANVSGTVASATVAASANSVAGANVSGEVAFAAVANSVAVANVSGIGNIATIDLNGDGATVLAGNGTFITPSAISTSNIINGTSNVDIATSDGNITMSVGGALIGTISQNTLAIGRLGGAGVGANSIALGYATAMTSQGINSVAIGPLSGANDQSSQAVAIGNVAGQTSQGDSSVAVGNQSGQISQGDTAVAIGAFAGKEFQGRNSIAIGRGAGNLNQPANTIILNASGLNYSGVSGQTDSFYVNPVRNDTGNTTNVVYYNTTTKEVTYGPGATPYGNTEVAAYLPTYTGNLGNVDSIGATGNIDTLGDVNVSLGNITVGGNVSATGFSGSGAALTSLTGANVTGTVASATVAASANAVAGANVTGEVAFAATANAVSGSNVSGQVASAASADLATFATTANAVAGANVSGEVAFAATANAVAGANVTGTVASATVAASANSVAGANVTGEVAFAQIANSVAGSNVTGEVTFAATANSVAGANVSGTVASATVAASANSVAGANVTGQVSFAATANSVSGANVSGTVASATVAATANSVAGANVTGEVAFAQVANSVAGANVTGTVANATFATTSGTAESVAGANVTGEVAFAATANSVAGANVTGAVAFATVANSVAGANVSGTVASATVAASANSVAGANVTGTVANANYAAYAGNVTIASQPNITSVGTLTTLAVSGNFTAGNVAAGNLLTANFVTGTLTTAAQPNITSVGTLLDLTVSGNATVEGNTITDNIIGRTGDITISASGTDQNITLVPTGTGYVDVSGALIKNVQDPVDVQDAATKGYVDATAAGLSVQDPCLVATDADLATITGGSVTYNNGTAGVGATLTLGTALTVLDGVTLAAGDRILVKNETNATYNGIYTWATGGTVLTRATDFDSTVDIIPGDYIFVTGGTQYENTGWVQTSTITTIGTDTIEFTQFSGTGGYTAGVGLSLDGTQFSLVDTSVTAGTYGNATHVVTQTVNSKGQITGISQQAVIANAETLAGTTLKNTVLSSNLTSVGTLVGLSVNGDVLITEDLSVDGNATVTGNLTATNIIGDGSQITNINYANIVDAYGNANVATYLSSGTDSTGYTTSGNIIADYFIGNGASLIDITGANVTGEVAFATTANSVAGANVSGEVAFAATANSVAGANVTGTVASATVAASANSVAGANVTGEVAFAATANSVAVANVSGIGNIATIDLNGDGATVLAGNGTFITPSASSSFIANGTSNVSIADSDGNITMAVGGELIGTISQFTLAIGQFTGAGIGSNSIALGLGAAQSSQGDNSVAIGKLAGAITQSSQSVAIGIYSGSEGQGANSVAIGANAGREGQGGNSIAIGRGAGNLNQPANTIILNATGANFNAVSAQTDSFYVNPVRNDTGNTTNAVYYNTTTKEVTYGPSSAGSSSIIANGTSNVSIATSDGNITMAVGGVLVGTIAQDRLSIGRSSGVPGANSIAIGYATALSGQSAQSVAIGMLAGATTQGFRSVAVGSGAGQSVQGSSTVAIGVQSGQINQGDDSVAIGAFAGKEGQQRNSIAIGRGAGVLNQPISTIILNASGTDFNAVSSQANSFYVNPVRNDTGNTTNVVYYNTTTKEITYGPAQAGATSLISNGTSNVSIATSGGNITMAVGGEPIGTISINTVAIGRSAGNGIGANSIAIGTFAVNTGQAPNAVAIGTFAGRTDQQGQAVAVGLYAGNDSQGDSSVAIGNQSGQISQGATAVAIGAFAGKEIQGRNSIAIGRGAGHLNQPANTIILNASGVNYSGVSGQTDSFYVDPVRTANVGGGMLAYNSTTKEVMVGIPQLPAFADLTAVASAVTSPVAGMIIYDTGNNRPAFYNGTSWAAI